MSEGRVSANRHPQRPAGGPNDAPSGGERENHLPKRRNLLRRRKHANPINAKPRDAQGRVIDVGPFKVHTDSHAAGRDEVEREAARLLALQRAAQELGPPPSVEEPDAEREQPEPGLEGDSSVGEDEGAEGPGEDGPTEVGPGYEGPEGYGDPTVSND